jgi:hypothetical protein
VRLREGVQPGADQFVKIGHVLATSGRMGTC